FRRAHGHVSDRLAGHRVPAADHAVAAAGEQRAAVGEEGGRPDRKSRSDQGAFELARAPVDDGDRAADAGGGDEAARPRPSRPPTRPPRYWALAPPRSRR